MPRRKVDPVLDLPFIRQLVALARAVGYTVERNDAEVPLFGGGACMYAQKRICISERFGELDALPVLIHEVAHALIHESPGRDSDEREAHEREANWVRASVLAALGLLMLLPAEAEGMATGPAPSDGASQAADAIIACMPPRVTHYLARLEPPQVTGHGFPASDEAVKQLILDAALILGFQVFWISGRAGIAGEHRAGARAITLSDELPLASEVAVLAHELAHAVQHPPGGEYLPPSSEERDEVERVAHAAAADLLRRFGLTDHAARLNAVGGSPPIGATADELEEARVIAKIIERAGTMYPQPKLPA